MTGTDAPAVPGSGADAGGSQAPVVPDSRADADGSEASAVPGSGADADGRAGRLLRSAGLMLRDTALVGLTGSTGLIGVGGAMVSTSLSLFLSDVVGASPLMIGLFFAGRAVMEILSEMAVAVLSDRLGNRRPLLVLCSLLSGAGVLSFCFLHEYYLVFASAVVLLGTGGSCFSQLFAYTREFAERRVLDAAFFNAAMRAVTSIAWIAGPPLAFLMIAHTGFRVLFLVAGALYLAAGLQAALQLPKLRTGRGAPQAGNPYRGIGRRMGVLMAAVLLLMTVNSVYQIDVSLYLTKQLHLGGEFPGLLIGLAAALEVPAMFVIGARVRSFGKWRTVIAAAGCATVFFALLPLAHTRGELLLLQVPNACWTAVVLSIPVTILQDNFTGDRVGVASSLYASSFKTGIMVGGTVTGLVTEWTGFSDVFWVCAALTAAATLLLALASGRADGADADSSTERRGADLQPGATSAAHAGVADPADAAG